MIYKHDRKPSGITICNCYMLNSVSERQNIQKQEIEPMVNCLKMIGEKDHQCMVGMEIFRTSVCSHFYQKPNFRYLFKSYKWNST